MDPYPTLFPGVLPWWFHAARFPHGGEDAPKAGDGPTEADGSDLAKAGKMKMTILYIFDVEVWLILLEIVSDFIVCFFSK